MLASLIDYCEASAALKDGIGTQLEVAAVGMQFVAQEHGSLEARIAFGEASAVCAHRDAAGIRRYITGEEPCTVREALVFLDKVMDLMARVAPGGAR